MKVSLAMLLKTNVEKMSDNRSLAMLMKQNELKSLSGDVDEKNGESRCGQGPLEILGMKDPPGMGMKMKVALTKCRAKNTA